MRRPGRLWLAFVDWVVETSLATPYFHLKHADGSMYMRRFWLMPRFLLQETVDDEGGKLLKPRAWLPFALRVHQICTIDFDRDMHDHPWSFVSLVLNGGYVERRPESQGASIWGPVRGDPDEPWSGELEEKGFNTVRMPGSIGFRSATDRHRIISCLPDTWTLVLQFRKSRSWGFYTPRGWVSWKEYTRLHV